MIKNLGLILILGVFMGGFSSTAWAVREQPLVEVMGDDPSYGTAGLFVVWSDDGRQMLGMRVRRDRRVEDYSLAQLINPGVVLLKKSKAFITKDVISARLQGFTGPQANATIVLTVLREYGIFSDDYRTISLPFHLMGPGAGGPTDVPFLYSLGLVLADGLFHPLNRLFMKTLMSGGSAVGIGIIEAFWNETLLASIDTSGLPSASTRLRSFIKGCKDLL